ncbi:Peroxidase [Handroanthus impetiginosus]|uniref:peroxidase n=1 Tax=Handroanthus impetiginosus TaxID=429701 RepID=A0A2G9I812_9LAMI|nr:Peroxidase [Handroanthus impetiginosus]
MCYSTSASGMHFHDCFVQSCDGCILIDGDNTEKTVGPNRLLRGYEVIDDAKKQLETVWRVPWSRLAGGPGWAVPTERRDGRVSLVSDTLNLLGFTDSIDVQKQKFQAKACQSFRYKLYNFTSSGGADPSINPAFLVTLQSLCPTDGDVGLDNDGENRFNKSFFATLGDGRGILESDQKLWTDELMRTFVQRYLGVRGLLGLTFSVEFGRSMVKMSNIEVKPGSDGEIRRVCSAVN